VELYIEILVILQTSVSRLFMMGECMRCSTDLSILLLVLSIVSERLNINGNNFGGSIPEEFSSWQFLRKYSVLSLLAEQRRGSDCLRRHAFTFIEHIDLSRNDFTGSFPLFLGDLRYLGKLACLQLHS
jgi:hypothetical protein